MTAATAFPSISTIGGDEPEALPLCRRPPQHRRPAAIRLMKPRFDGTPGEGELGPVRGERAGRELIDARLARPDGDGCVLPRIERHVLECLLAARGRMDAIEIERKHVAELELLVVLQKVQLVPPGGRPRIRGDLGLEPALALQLAGE